MTDTDDAAYDTESPRDTSRDYRVRNDELRSLVKKWRDQGTGNVDWNEYNEGLHDALRGCADELEGLIDDAE